MLEKQRNGISNEAELPTNVKLVVTTPIAVKGLEIEIFVIARFKDYN